MLGKVARRLAFTFLAIVCVFGMGFAARPALSQANLTISAAISMKDSLDEIQRDFTAANPSVTVACNYGSSGTLQRQIEQGAPVDVYVPHRPSRWMRSKQKGLLLSGTRKNLLRNEVVLIVPKNSSSHISSFQDLARPM